MTTKSSRVQIQYAATEEIAKGCFVVRAALGAGRVAYHNGPKDFAYFTAEQAERLATRVNDARAIDLDHWDDGSFCDMTIRDLEDEYQARGVL